MKMSGRGNSDESHGLPLAIDGFVQDGIDDVFVHAAIAIDYGESWQSEESKHLQIICDSGNNF
jgi:hypothetical protein